MKSLYIKNYKNLRELSLSALASVNLIVGRNNVGKSALLEAISLYLANGNEEWLWTILGFRGEAVKIDFEKKEIDFNKVLLEHYSSLFTDCKKEFSDSNVISIGTADDVLSIKLVHIAEDTDDTNRIMAKRYWTYIDTDDAFGTFSSHYLGDGLEILNNSVSKMTIPLFQRRTLGSVKDKLTFEYISVQDFQLWKNASLFDRISLSDKEEYVVEALRIIEPRIDRLNFLNENEYSTLRIPFVTLRGTTQRFRLSSMGDGINRILSVILALVNCTDGVFLLDEFETGLHYTVQTQLWRIVFMMADKLNIQVFVTSHSRDCIDSFIEADEKNAGQIIRLDKRGENIVAVNYNKKEDMELIARNEIEIR